MCVNIEISFIDGESPQRTLICMAYLHNKTIHDMILYATNRSIEIFDAMWLLLIIESCQ